jgi:ribosome-associated protein
MWWKIKCTPIRQHWVSVVSKQVKESEVQMIAIRAQGAGGQHVNKVSSAIHLRFDIEASSLDEELKDRLKALPDRRINREGVIVLKSQGTRSQDMNRMMALNRLYELIERVQEAPVTRKRTKPPKRAQENRLNNKKMTAQNKQRRAKPQV